MFIQGGFDDNSPLDSVECFDPDANIWTMVPNMTCCRGGVGSATLGKQILRDIFLFILLFVLTFKAVVFIQLGGMMVQPI